MNKVFLGTVLSISVLFGSSNYYGSTTAPVVIAGAIIKTSHIDTSQKYKRSDCPICKGKGWYMSGDGISKVECGYCEPDKDKAAGQTVPHKLKISHR